jgi:hypothetical protein
MFCKRKERIQRMNEELERLRAEQDESGPSVSHSGRRMTDVQFFNSLPQGTGIKVGRA